MWMILLNMRVPVSCLLISFITEGAGIWSKIKMHPFDMSTEDLLATWSEESFPANVARFCTIVS